MTEISKDLTINISGWQDGIGKSSLDGFADMMGVNINDNPGMVSANFKFNKVQENTASQTATFLGSDYVTISATSAYRGTYVGRAVTFTTTGTLPTGLTAGTVYYISANSSPTDTHFRISTSLSGALAGTTYSSINQATGSGVHTINFITPQKITYWTKGGLGNIYALDSNQRLWYCGANGVTSPWYLIDGNTGAGAANGNGLIYYKGYILVFTAGQVDALTDFGTIPSSFTWKLSFQTVTISNSMSNGGNGAIPFLSVNDNSIYFANGVVGNNYLIGMFEEVAGQTFNPNTGTTFTFIKDVITLPFENDSGFATAINEISQYLVIGTYSNKVFFWDKKSPSFTTFQQLEETRISNIEVVGGVAYAWIKNSGNIYAIDTVSHTQFLKLPDQLTNGYYLYNAGQDSISINATAIYNRELLFSMSIIGTSTVVNYLMSYNLDTKKLTKKNISPLGESTDRNGSEYGRITSIFPNVENIFISSSQYINSTSTYNYAVGSLYFQTLTTSGTPSYYVYDNYEPYIITGLFQFGDTYAKRTVKEFSVSFVRPLIASQGVKISYRRDDYSSFTDLITIDYATNGAVKEIKLPAPISDIIDLQIKIQLSGTGLTSPRIKNIRLLQ